MRTAWNGRRRLSLLLGALLGLALAHCTDPILPDPIPRDPQIGFLKTLGDIPLFAPREPVGGVPPSGANTFDTTGVRAPHVLEADGLFFMYYEGVDDTSFVSMGIGVAQSDNRGFTFERLKDSNLLLARRNRIAGDVSPLFPPNPLPPRQADSFDSEGVQHPMVLRNCPFTTPPGGSCLFYSGPGVQVGATDDDTDGLKEGLGNSVVTRPGIAPEDRAIPQVPSGISFVEIPDPAAGLNITQVAANAIPILLADKYVEESFESDAGLSACGGAPPCAADDDFYTEIAPSFDPTVEACDRRSFTPAELTNLSATRQNLGVDNTGTGLGIQAGPFPWESGGVSAPFVIQPSGSSNLLMYYTCTEEFGEQTARGCEERLVSRICLAELVQDASGRVFARRRIVSNSDVSYASPSSPNIALANNIVVQGGNFVDQNSFDQSGVSDPSILISFSVTGRALWRMWYTGIDENNAHRLGITGSFNGFDWDADDAELRVSTIIPSNPILVQASRSTAPASFFASDRILRVYYESLTSGTQGSINLGTLYNLNDAIAPFIDVVSPTGGAVDQGCSVLVSLDFSDDGGSGIDQQSFDVEFKDVTIDNVSTPARQIIFVNALTTDTVTVAQNENFAGQFPSFRYSSSDSASVELELQQFRLNSPIVPGETAIINLEIVIFDRKGNRTVNNANISLTEGGTATSCN